MKRFRLRFFVFTLLILNVGYGASDNAGNRYGEAYKAYLDARSPIPENGIKHFVYFARDREAIHDHPFLKHSRFQGAQIMYLWSNLEPKQNEYDFSEIRADYEFLKSHGKQLFIQLQDATFDPENRGIPDYLASEDYDGGAIEQHNDSGIVDGWVAKRWNAKTRERFGRLLQALGEVFDGKIEGINLQETAIGVSRERDDSFSPSIYRDSIKATMRKLKSAFPKSTTMQYANFMPGEWLPWDDQGYLRSIYEFGDEIGVGLGAPDLMIKRKGQLNHALAMMHEREYQVPLGIAIQDGNYVGLTGADFPPDSTQPGGETVIVRDRINIVPQLHAFAEHFLGVNYMFWVNQAPYFEEDVLPCFAEE